MIHVLFVCLGNICRSPMAEAVFRHLVQEQGMENRFQIDSAGLGGWHEGNPPHEGTRRVLTEQGIAHASIKARQIRPIDFDQFDYIVCMDEENLAGLRRMAPPGKPIYRLMEFAQEVGEENVEDPYYTGRFDYVYELVQAGCQGLLRHILSQESR